MKVKGKCTMCGIEADLTVIDDEERVCDSCLDEYIQCAECQEYYQVNAIKFFEMKDGRMLCEWCGEDEDEDDVAEVHDWT